MSEIRETDYLARGSAINAMVLGRGDKASRSTTGVIASGWPGFGTAFSMQRLSLKWILLGDSTLVGMVREAFPKVKVLLWEHMQWDKLAAVDTRQWIQSDLMDCLKKLRNHCPVPIDLWNDVLLEDMER